ncbi:MAG: hypothetical protein R3F19_12810 [Verrucomicrobiales bacterium]
MNNTNPQWPFPFSCGRTSRPVCHLIKKRRSSDSTTVTLHFSKFGSNKLYQLINTFYGYCYTRARPAEKVKKNLLSFCGKW